LLLQVERQGFVIANPGGSDRDRRDVKLLWYPHLNVCDANNDVFELIMLPGISRPLNHGKGGIILSFVVRYTSVRLATCTHKFVIFDVEEDELRP
jgi:hypothetical protein